MRLGYAAAARHSRMNLTRPHHCIIAPVAEAIAQANAKERIRTAQSVRGAG